MRFEQFKEFFQKYWDEHLKANDYLNYVPSDLIGAVIDNGYTSALDRRIDLLINTFVPKDLVEEIDWFMYERSSTANIIEIIDGRIYKINTVNDFFNYLEKEYKWN
jgi:hypothetical protein